MLQTSVQNLYTGNAVFYGCADLEEIKIPEKITVIGNAAFSDCYSLKSVELPRVKVISDFRDHIQ